MQRDANTPPAQSRDDAEVDEYGLDEDLRLQQGMYWRLANAERDDSLEPTADDEDEMRWFIFERDWYTEPTSVIEALAVVRLNFGYPVGVTT